MTAIVAGGVSGIAAAVSGFAGLVRVVVAPKIANLRSELSTSLNEHHARIESIQTAAGETRATVQKHDQRLDDCHAQLQRLETWRAAADVRFEGVAAGLDRTETALDRIRTIDPR